MPSSHLRDQLQDALAGAYVVERELAGGGMSRGFVATDDGGAAHNTIESVLFPGPDQRLHTGDDVTYTLDKFQRQIVITDMNDDLRCITVTITYQSGASTRTYTLTAYMSTFA